MSQLKLLDGARQAPQFYVDMAAYDRVYQANEKAFTIGTYRHLYSRSWVGWNDPAAWYAVVNALSHAAAGWTIIPEHLRDHINRDHHTLWFTPQVVGRILSGIYTAMYSTLVEHHQQTIMPFEQYRGRARSIYYLLDGPEAVKVYGPDTGRMLMMGLRRTLLSTARSNMLAQSRGKFYTYPDIQERLYLDPEDLKWKERKFKLATGKPPAMRVISRRRR